MPASDAKPSGKALKVARALPDVFAPEPRILKRADLEQVLECDADSSSDAYFGAPRKLMRMMRVTKTVVPPKFEKGLETVPGDITTDVESSAQEGGDGDDANRAAVQLANTKRGRDRLWQFRVLVFLFCIVNPLFDC